MIEHGKGLGCFVGWHEVFQVVLHDVIPGEVRFDVPEQVERQAPGLRTAAQLLIARFCGCSNLVAQGDLRAVLSLVPQTTHAAAFPRGNG